MSGAMTRVGLLVRASSTILGEDFDAGVRVFWKESGTPSGKSVATRCEIYFSCSRVMHDSSTEMSTFRRSDSGPSSSTFNRRVRACTNLSYKEPAPREGKA
eukprot:5089270-Pleurochrysis_carterae.AAC.2